jgi:uroporphyrinogen decarboxylase
MDSRELVRRIINREPVDRVAIFDSFWNEVREDFVSEGIPDGITLEEYFEFDIGMVWFEQSFLLPPKIHSETDEYRVVSDDWGTLNKELIHEQTTPGLIGFAIQDRATWEKDYKSKLEYHPDRIDWETLQQKYEQLRATDRFVALSMLDPFECTWHKVGPDKQLEMMVLDPDWLVDMYETDTALIEAAWRDLWAKGIQPDALWLYGDIAYNAGMMFSPRHYRKLLLPFHKRLCNLAHENGAQVIYHTDGKIEKAIPLLIEAGFDCLQPMEVKAGVDVRGLKVNYGTQLAFMGNIDARLFQENDLAGLEAELRAKIPAAMKGSGYIYHSDHSIPPGTQLKTYQFAIDLVREIGCYREKAHKRSQPG